MTEYKIEIDEAVFSEVIKRKTNNLKDNLLHEYSIYDIANDEGYLQSFRYKLNSELKPLKNRIDRTIFISELLVDIGEKRLIVEKDFDNNINSCQLLAESF